MKIKRILFYVISVLVCFLLQTSVFNFLKLAGVMPNYSADLNGYDRIYSRQESGDRDRICLWTAD